MSDPVRADVAGGVPDDELTRLRTLVGPNERSYQDLVDELAAAERAGRDSEEANGVLRAQIAELTTSLRRAQQDQYHVLSLLGRSARLRSAIRRSAGTR
ncbi:MAG: hypothetical protein ABIP17_17500 [Ilumatobacteraceae bacterium]